MGQEGKLSWAKYLKEASNLKVTVAISYTDRQEVVDAILSARTAPALLLQAQGDVIYRTLRCVDDSKDCAYII